MPEWARSGVRSIHNPICYAHKVKGNSSYPQLMNLIGDTLYLPLIDAVLEDNQDVQLCAGIGIHVLTDDYRSTISTNAAISGRYSESIEHMQIALAINPEFLLPKSKLSLYELQALAIFIALLIRLTTGIPLDIPWWVDARGDDIQGIGNTNVRTFRTGNRFQYLLTGAIKIPFFRC